MLSHPLKVSDNKRFLVCADGRPFFYLGDTVWELFHRYPLEDAELYLKDRAAKRFTVIQAVVLAECDGLRVPNALGDLPLHNEDPTQPNEAYFRYVDAIVDKAESLGLTMGMLPTWGDKWNLKWGDGPEIFTPENAYIYGQFIGNRYRNKPIIWILGGDRPIETEIHRAIIERMAAGVRAGDSGRNLITLHPMGGQTSAQNFHQSEWLDFNMWQSGHGRNTANYDFIAADYARTPTKPCLDGEPGYEDHAAGFDINNGYLEDYDCRKALYWALFAGACGHTYGAHPNWQMFQAGRKPFTWVRRSWTEGLRLPGSSQMQHARALLEMRPYLTRIPDQELIRSEVGTGARHARATRDLEGTYALIYVPTGQPVEIETARLSAKTLRASWFDPRQGIAFPFGEFAVQEPLTFTPPSGGPDWALILDDAARDYPLPVTR